MMSALNSWIRTLGTDGDFKLKTILWAIIVYQGVIWLSEFWLPVTRTVVEFTLLSVVVFELIFPRHIWTKRLLQIAAMIAVHAYALDYRVVSAPLESRSDLLPLIGANVAPFFPYMWFSMAAALGYLVLLYWTTTKLRTIVLLLAVVITFCIIDSFTFFILWKRIAVIILCGMLLVIVDHFRHFRDKHPASWSYIVEYPGTVLAPVVILLSLMMVAGALAPNVRPLITDPYTAWKHYRGEEVTRLGKGLGSYISLESSSSNASGYSRNDEELGGGFLFNFSEVMRVHTTQRSYWRGETRSLYTGRGWEQSEADLEASAFAIALDESFPTSEPFDTSLRRTVEVEQTFYIQEGISYPVLFGAFSPTRLVSRSGEDEEGEENEAEAPENTEHLDWISRVTWSPEQHELRWASEDEDDYPAMYSIVSDVPILDEDGLRAAYDSQFELPRSFAPYLQLPDTLPERVRELAQQVTAEAATVYDKVKSIEQYLYHEFPYTNQPDLSEAKSEDFVDRFLFEVQEGYCDYYSTAMVVMVRSLGIPARWVKGYTSGTAQIYEEYEDYNIPYDYLELISQGDEGTFIVRNSDAHSWVEVYFPGWGWMPFEPTSGFVLPYASEEEQEETAEAPLKDLAAYAPLQPREDGGGHTRTSFVAIVVIVVILIVILIVFRRRLSGWWRMLPLSRQRTDNYNAKIVLEVERFMKFAARKGLGRSRYQTMREWMELWVERYTWIGVELDELVRLFERAKYSPIGATRTDAERTITLVKTLRQKLK